MPLCRFSDSTKTIIHLSGLRTSPYGSLYLAIDSYPLILFVINQQCSEQTGFLSLLSHSSKLTKSKEGIMGTSNVQQFCQKSRWQPWLTIGIWSEEQSCGNEPSTLMLTWVDSIRIELNCRTSCWHPRTACWCGEISTYIEVGIGFRTLVNMSPQRQANIVLSLSHL